MFKDQRGIALFMALIIIMFSALMTLVLTGMSIINIKLCGNLATHKKAVYAAEAGKEYARALLINNLPQIPGCEDDINLDNNSSFNINIDPQDNENNLYLIKSEGKYKKSRKKYKISLKINGE